jgi:twinkle protein
MAFYNNKKIKESFILSQQFLKIPKNYMSLRGITDKTMAFYDVRTLVNGLSGKAEKIIFPYGDKAQKVRELDNKEFYVTGEFKDTSIFGKERFTPGQSQAITITEGELDALSAFQMLGSKYPVVSVRSAGSAGDDIKRARDFINSFERIYLCLDNDAPGEKAAKDISRLFDINKVYFVQLGPLKDANEYLKAGKEKEFVGAWWSAKRFVPKGIISSLEEQLAIFEEQRQNALVDYPYPTLQEMTYGIRSREMNVVLAQEKIGKTEFIRSLEYHILKNTNYNIGVIHLEEERQRTLQGFVGLHLQQPVHLPDSLVSVSDQQKAFKELNATGNRIHIYPHFGSDDPNQILDIIRSMVVVLGCKFIFIDHITMLVTGFENDDERKKLDYLSTKLVELTRELDCTIFMISHVNEQGRPRGSMNITKVADLIISLYRDIEAQDEDTRNTTLLTIRGNRFAGRTGPAGMLKFSPNTFTIRELRFDEVAKIDWTESGGLHEFAA